MISILKKVVVGSGVIQLKKMLGNKSILLLATIFLSLIIIEISFQITFKSGFFKDSVTEDQNRKCTYTVYENLYHQSEENLVEFCRDSNGFIEHQNFSDKNSTIYVCGGSTTETYIVPPSKRWPAILEVLSSNKIVNDSLSGRAFSECLQRVELYLTKFPKPQRILLLNNVNTLGKFAINNSTAKEVNLSTNLKMKISQLYYSMFPGIVSARGSGFFQEIIRRESKVKTADLIVKNNDHSFKIDRTYSMALNSNCCHIASAINLPNSEKFFDWNSNKNINNYVRFYEHELNILQKTLDKFDIPRDHILFGFESYSYVLGKSQFGDPIRRQLLNDYNVPAKSFSSRESFSIVNRFDDAIRSLLVSKKWNYFNSQDFLMRPEYFYDAVHLTPLGSEAMAQGVFQIIRNNVSQSIKSPNENLDYIK